MASKTFRLIARSNNFRSASIALAIAVAGAGALAGNAGAATLDWTGANSATNLNWSNALNWNPNTAAPANSVYTDTAHFGLADYTGLQPNMDATRAINGLLIDGAGALTFTGTGQLQLGTGGLTMSATAGTVDLSATGGLRVDQVQTWTNASANNLALSTITRSGTGRTLTLINTGGGQVLTTSTNDATGLLNGAWMNYTDATGSYYATASGGAVTGYTGGVAITDVNAIGTTSAGTENDDIAGASLTNNILLAPAVANTLRYSGAAQTIQLGDASTSNVTLQLNGLMSAGTGTLTIADGTPDHTGGVVVTGETVLTAAGADLELTAPLINTSGSTRTVSVAGAHHVLLNSVVNNGTGTLSFNGFGGTYYVGSSGTLLLNAASGPIAWRSAIAGSGFDNPVIADNPTLGPSSVEITGTNTVTLAGDNTYSGGTIIGAGATVAVGARYYGTGTQNFGTGTITINNGATITTVATNQSFYVTTGGAAGNAQIWNGSWTMAGGGISFNANSSGGPYGNVLLNAPNIVFTNNGSTTDPGIGDVSASDPSYGMTVITTNTATHTLIFGGTNSFTGPLQIGDGTNPGRVTIRGSSPAWAGNITLNANSSLDIYTNDGLGTSTVNINGGTLADYSGYHPVALSTPVTFNINDDFNAYGPTGRSFDLGNLSTINLNASATITLTNNSSVVLRNIQGGAQGLTVVPGTGITSTSITLAGNNNIGGPITISGVTLNGSTGGLGHYFGALNITNGSYLSMYGTNYALNRDLVLNIDATSTWTPARESTVVLGGINGAGNQDPKGYDNGNLDITGSGNYVYSGNLNPGTGGGVQLTMAGQGTQTFSGANANNGNTVAAAGTLNLDFSGPIATAPQHPNEDIMYHNAAPMSAPIVPGAFVMNGGTLQLSGLAGATNLQRSGSLSIGVGGSNIVVNPAATNTLSLLTGNMTRASAGTLNVVLPTGAQVAPTFTALGDNLTNAPNGLATTAANVNGIVGGHVTVNGSDWATTNGTHTPAGGMTVLAGVDNTTTLTVPDSSLIAVGDNVVGSGIQNLTTVTGIVDATHVTINNPGTFTGPGFSNLSFFATGTPGTWGSDGTNLYISGAVPNGTAISFNSLAGTLPAGLRAGTLYYAIGGDNSTYFYVTPTPGAGTGLGNAGFNSGTASFDIVGSLNAFTAYDSFVGDGSAAATSNPLLTGSGTLSAATTVNSLKIATTAAAQSLDLGGQQLKLTTTNGGLLFTGADDYTIGGATGSSITADSDTVQTQGFGNGAPTINTPAVIIQQYGTGNLTISAPIVNGNGTLFNQNDGTTTHPTGNTSLTKSGPGTLTLTGANTYTGPTYLNAGITNVSSVIGTATSLGNGGQIVFNGGTLQYAAGYSADSGDITQRSASATSILAGGVTIDTNGNNIAYASPLGGTNSVDNQVNRSSSIPSGGLTKTGLGTLSVASQNNYAGATTVTGGGTLSVPTLADGGAVSAIGTSTRIAGNLVLDNGTLQYTGSGSSTDRDLTITTNGGTLDASGTGAVLFAPAADINTNTIALGGTGTHQLTLTGTGTAGNTMGLILADQGANATSLVKSNTGTWVLNNGAASYSGGTTVNGGVLLVANTTGSATGTGVVALNGGTLGGSGTISGAVNAGAAAHTIAPSASLSSTSATKLTVGSLKTNSNTTLAFNVVTPNTAGGSDQIVVSGAGGLDLSGGGMLAITGHGVGQGSLGYYEAIQYTGAITGAYTAISRPAADANKIVYTLDIAHDPGFIDIHRGFDGDANDDGVVNFADFVRLSNNYGDVDAGWFGGDFNGDGVTNFADFVRLSNNYGGLMGGGSIVVSSDEMAALSAFGAAAADAVPEPASLALLGIGAAALLTRKRRK
jgi:fibronectin-binding autotransporter adhesin